MRNKETGEFELVVGNGQLVSGFFIVIVLFAVGMVMGYILGQNSEKTAKSQQGEAAPCVATENRPQPAQPAAQTPAPQPSEGTDGQPDAASHPATEPAKDTDPAPTTQPARTEPAKPAPPAPAPVKAADVTSEVPTGFYWQVTATANQESARATVKTLKDREFPALLTPGRNNLTRVLVGPYKDTASKGKAKAELEAMGLKPFAFNQP